MICPGPREYITSSQRIQILDGGGREGGGERERERERENGWKEENGVMGGWGGGGGGGGEKDGLDGSRHNLVTRSRPSHPPPHPPSKSMLISEASEEYIAPL